jgi:hypothetical protein
LLFERDDFLLDERVEFIEVGREIFRDVEIQESFLRLLLRALVILEMRPLGLYHGGVSPRDVDQVRLGRVVRRGRVP